MNPSNPFLRTDTDSPVGFQIGSEYDNPAKTAFPINFCALLNHNLGVELKNFSFLGVHGLDTLSYPNLAGVADSNILNRGNLTISDTDGNTMINASYNGTSIWEFTENTQYWNTFYVYFNDGVYDGVQDYKHQLGSMVVGKYWDAPNSPDLKLTMERRFDGIKKTKTIGGKTLANIYYDGPTEWTMNNSADGTYKYPPFELDLATTDATDGDTFNARAKSGLGRKGLRSWNLTFSYISGDDMWMANETSNTIIADDTISDDANPMLSDDSFNFVWNCTLGGTLPFIFQPDNTNSAPDQFSICTFASNSLKINQVAPNVYNLSVTIDEVA